MEAAIFNGLKEERPREEQEQGDRKSRNLNVCKEEKPRRVEVADFSGKDPYNRIDNTERYRRLNQIPDDVKLEASSVCLEGVPVKNRRKEEKKNEEKSEGEENDEEDGEEIAKGTMMVLGTGMVGMGSEDGYLGRSMLENMENRNGLTRSSGFGRDGPSFTGHQRTQQVGDPRQSIASGPNWASGESYWYCGSGARTSCSSG